MADKRFEYIVSVTVIEAANERNRRHASVRGEVEAPDEAEAARVAVKRASEKAHAGRLMGGVFDGGT